jgi:LPPG:FO 2-phospho-L-lactate transferase
MNSEPTVVVLSGGVGGAKFADGLYRLFPKGKLTVCVNTGDDFNLFGLMISPDLDTVCYALADRENPDTGWGQAGETWSVLNSISDLGGPVWFKLGDKDLATHLERTRLLGEGYTLTEITARICSRFGIQAKVLPMSDQKVRTSVDTEEFGWIPFQEYFVEKGCEPRVRGFQYQGISDAKPAVGLIDAINDADVVIIGPSNPLVSIEPILSVAGIREALLGKRVVAVSPIIGGKTIKGPLAKMYRELGYVPSAVTVAEGYRGLIQGYIMDSIDRDLSSQVNQWDIITLVTDTLMKSPSDRVILARKVIEFIQKELSG